MMLVIFQYGLNNFFISSGTFGKWFHCYFFRNLRYLHKRMPDQER